jgi:inner membrane protein
LGGAWATRRPVRFWVLAMACAVLPDADVAAFWLGIPYGSVFGHRGITHSLAFAMLLGFAVALVFFRGAPNRRALALFFALATASHGALDALTNGGLGVAFFAPFSGERFFFPFRPVQVSPIGAAEFFGEWGLRVIESEFLWVWLPASLVVGVLMLARLSVRSHQP